MRNRSKLVLAVGVLGMALASASVAREDALPRGADNRRGETERHQGRDDAAKSSLSIAPSTSRASDDPAGDRRGRKDVPDDNRRDRRNDDGPNHR